MSSPMEKAVSFLQPLVRPEHYPSTHPLVTFGRHPLFEPWLIHSILSLDPLHAAFYELNRQLRHLPAPLPRIHEWLQEYDARLAGSFVTQCFFPHEDWKYGDIDIFCREGDTRTLVERLTRQHGWRVNHDSREDDYQESVSDVFHSVKLVCQGVTLNLVAYKSPLVDAQIDKSFDLDGCTMRWDGKRWRWHCQMGLTNYLHRRWTLIDWTRNSPLLLAIRVLKYRYRGFKIDISGHPDAREIEIKINELLANHKRRKLTPARE